MIENTRLLLMFLFYFSNSVIFTEFRRSKVQMFFQIVDGEVKESGTWHDSDGTWGTYGYAADVKEVVNTEGSCPAIGQDRDEPWVESWEVKNGCPKPICPQPMLDITDKWTRSAGRTKKNGVTIKKFNMVLLQQFIFHLVMLHGLSV